MHLCKQWSLAQVLCLLHGPAGPDAACVIGRKFDSHLSQQLWLDPAVLAYAGQPDQLYPVALAIQCTTGTELLKQHLLPFDQSGNSYARCSPLFQKAHKTCLA